MRGNPTEVACYGTDGQPALNPWGGMAYITSKYDESSRLVEENYFGPDGKPVLSMSGYAKFTTQYDLLGNVTETAYFGVNGEPTLSSENVARIVNRFDERGNRIESAYYDVSGAPALYINGVARETIKYDECSNPIEHAYYGTDGQPKLDDEEGTARYTTKYNERDWRIEESCFGTDGEPIIAKLGYFRIVYQYNEYGVQTKISCYDTSGDDITWQLTRTTVVTISEVYAGGLAEQCGIQVNDVIIEYDNWNRFNYNDPVTFWWDLIDLSGSTQITPHTVVIFRTDGSFDDSEIIRCDIEAGWLGWEFVRSGFDTSQAMELKGKYDKWCEENSLSA